MPRADRLSGLRCTASAHRERAAEAAADLDGPNDVVAVIHNDDAEWLDLIDTGVGRIQRAGDAVEANFTLDVALELATQRFGVDQRGVGLRYRRSCPQLNQAQARDSAM